MCKNCRIIEGTFQAATSNPHMNYEPVYYLLSEMIRQKRLKIYAGDCIFDEALSILSMERHYTVSFYLECTSCYKVFFYGACIRGTPIYEQVDNINKEKIERLIWGKEGTYFA